MSCDITDSLGIRLLTSRVVHKERALWQCPHGKGGRDELEVKLVASRSTDHHLHP